MIMWISRGFRNLPRTDVQEPERQCERTASGEGTAGRFTVTRRLRCPGYCGHGHSRTPSIVPQYFQVSFGTCGPRESPLALKSPWNEAVNEQPAYLPDWTRPFKVPSLPISQLKSISFLRASWQLSQSWLQAFP